MMKLSREKPNIVTVIIPKAPRTAANMTYPARIDCEKSSSEEVIYLTFFINSNPSNLTNIHQTITNGIQYITMCQT